MTGNDHRTGIHLLVEGGSLDAPAPAYRPTRALAAVGLAVFLVISFVVARLG